MGKGKVGWFVAGAALALGGSCVLQGDPEPGPKGEPGTPGKDGMPGATTVTIDGGTVTIQQLADLVAALQAQVQEQADPDCPAGYVKIGPGNSSVADSVLCTKGADEVVKVGHGPAAFWIDRYEASVWDSADATGTQYGVSGDDYPPDFLKNGQRTPAFIELYAVSKVGVTPSRNLT